MSQTDQKQTWRSRLGWLAGQLFVIFLGVSAAFVVENYRETLSQKEELHQAVAGIITELEHYEQRSVQFSDAFNAAIARNVIVTRVFKGGVKSATLAVT